MSEVLVFAGKGLVVFATVAAVAIVIAALAQRRRSDLRIEVTSLNRRFEALRDAVLIRALPKKAARALQKERRRARKKVRTGPRVYVLDFKGDVLAHAVEPLRDEVSAILGVARAEDEVVLRLESPGGVVHGYGLAATELQRLRDAAVPMTVCVDKVAASGGYLMAAIANRILAAPFAIIGSIGVAAPVPNVHRLLQRLGIDYEEMTGGEYKRTVGALAAPDPKGRQKFQEQIDATHALFKEHVARLRPGLDMARVATGEYWHGQQALALGLVDGLQSSDDYLQERAKDAELLHLRCRKPPAWQERLASGLQLLLRGA
jgi:serine protease SohB